MRHVSHNGHTHHRIRPSMATSSQAPLADVIAEYRSTGVSSAARRDWLVRLANDGRAAALATFAELVASDPPASVEDVLVAFAPLLRKPSALPVEALFPRLLDATVHLSVAAIVLDVANHYVRTGRLRPHPANDRSAKLAALFESVAIRLEKLPKTPPGDAAEWEAQRRAAEEGFALLISLCDTLALVGDRSVCDPLRAALDLPHRRLRTEVAAALARLGQSDGIDALAQMTAEPVVRTRAIAYLEELGLGDQVPAEYRSAIARAEGQLAQWLAAPLQFGIGPHEIELVDRRTQSWPGFDEPVECFLFRYAYRAGQGELAGIGIVGPLVYAAPCGADELGVDDLYALFAGYHAEHESIGETPFAEAPGVERGMVEALVRELGEDYAEVVPVAVGRFFGERHIVFTATRNGGRGTLVLDAGEPHWYAAGDLRSPLGATQAYQIHKGRKLLRAFNAVEKASDATAE